MIDASRKDALSAARIGKPSSDGDVVDMLVGREDNRESSADSDLVDLSSKFNIKSSAGTANPGMVKSEPGRRLSISANQPSCPYASNSQIRQRTISNESMKSSTSEGDKKVGIKSAYDQFKALQAGKNGSTSINAVSYRDVKPRDGLASPSSSSSSPATGKKDAGLDSGYLSSINTSSSGALRNDNKTKVLAPGVIEGPVSYMVTLKSGTIVTIPKEFTQTACYTAKQLAGLSEEQKNLIERLEGLIRDRTSLLRMYTENIARERKPYYAFDRGKQFLADFKIIRAGSDGYPDKYRALSIQSHAKQYREAELSIRRAEDQM